jgi:hypothetical protein
VISSKQLKASTSCQRLYDGPASESAKISLLSQVFSVHLFHIRHVPDKNLTDRGRAILFELRHSCKHDAANKKLQVLQRDSKVGFWLSECQKGAMDLTTAHLFHIRHVPDKNLTDRGRAILFELRHSCKLSHLTMMPQTRNSRSCSVIQKLAFG